jgi:MscS family membrane protein
MNEILNVIAENWSQLLISLLTVVIGYLDSIWVVRIPLRWLIRRTTTTLDNVLIKAIERPLGWILFALFLQFAGLSLMPMFPDNEVSTLMTGFIIFYLIAAAYTILRVINTLVEWFSENPPSNVDQEGITRILPIVRTFSRFLVIIAATITLLAYLGVDITALAASLGVAGLAISLAAKETIEDLIGGFFILIDRPFRIGDRIDIEQLGIWGDVEEIGLRTCRIRTRDNRMVIIPNAQISRSHIVNYTFPDPQYRIQMEIGLAYDTDIEKARRLIIEAVQNIEGVLKDKPVDALYLQMGESAMTFRIRWWIESYVDTRRMFDKVNTALQECFDENGIVSPYPTQDINFRIDPDNTERLSKAFSKAG